MTRTPCFIWVCNKLTTVWAPTKKLLASWQFSGPYVVTKYGSGWRKDVVNQCLEFNQYPNLSEGADCVGGQLRGDKRVPLQWRNQIWQSLQEGAGKRCSECGKGLYRLTLSAPSCTHGRWPEPPGLGSGWAPPVWRARPRTGLNHWSPNCTAAAAPPRARPPWSRSRFAAGRRKDWTPNHHAKHLPQGTYFNAMSFVVVEVLHWSAE